MRSIPHPVLHTLFITQLVRDFAPLTLFAAFAFSFPVVRDSTARFRFAWIVQRRSGSSRCATSLILITVDSRYERAVVFDQCLSLQHAV